MCKTIDLTSLVDAKLKQRCRAPARYRKRERARGRVASQGATTARRQVFACVRIVGTQVLDCIITFYQL